jgi:MSHA biogenesis protein MshJ
VKKILAFFNKLGSRERLGLVLALLVAVYLIMDLALLGPEQKRQKSVKAELAKLNADLTGLRNEMVIVKANIEKDPFAKDRAQLDQFKRVVDEATAFLAKVESDPRQVGAVLRQLIGSTPGVSLVSLKTLPVVAIVDSKAAAGAAKGAPTRSVYRRGIEVTVKGNYLAMLPYLEKLQNMSTRVLWAEAELDARTYPDSLLKLTIYTLSAQAEASLG